MPDDLFSKGSNKILMIVNCIKNDAMTDPFFKLLFVL